MNKETKERYYSQLLDYKIIDYKIIDNFPILIISKKVGTEEYIHEVVVSKNYKGTEPGVLLGLPGYNSFLG